MRVEVTAAEEANAETRSEVDACLEEAQKESAALRASLSAAVETQESSSKKAAEVATQLADVQKLLAQERNATAAMEVEVQAEEEANAETRSTADACVYEMQKETAELCASLSPPAAIEKQESSAKKAADVASELADVQQCLAEERINATPAAKMAVKAAEEANAETRLKTDASVQEAQKESTGRRASRSGAIEKQELSEKKAAGVASELAGVYYRSSWPRGPSR